MKKFLQTCCFSIATCFLVGITLYGCQKSSTDWKTEMLGSQVYAKYLRDGIEMHNNLAANGMDSKHVKACTEATGRKYGQAWIDCLASSEQDKRYATLFVQHVANVKALTAQYPEIVNLPKNDKKVLMVTAITKQMTGYALNRTL